MPLYPHHQAKRPQKSRYILAGLLFTLILGACSTSDTKDTAEKRFDPSRPTTFAEYTQWREENDPDGQIYAEFKKWEAAYKVWKQKQASSLRK